MIFGSNVNALRDTGKPLTLAQTSAESPEIQGGFPTGKADSESFPILGPITLPQALDASGRGALAGQ
jgi:hypothetical protein